MATLKTLFDPDLMTEMVDAGYVRVQHHPTLPLMIANYSEKAQYEKVWNPVTLTCRGLIYKPTGEIVARPYAKFFNYGDDSNTGPLDLNARATVTDKLDGSLGIAYPTPDGPAIATRGSFTSDQAIHATEVLRSRYPDWQCHQGMTALFEIVYPQNRIVVDYGQQDDLILHGLVDIHDGYVYQDVTRWDWPGPVVQRFPYPTLAAALAAPARPNAEGFVVLLEDQTMVKLKQEDYVTLHRIITGLNAKTVWEWLGEGKTVGDLCVTIPDEFAAWVEDIAAELGEAYDQILNEAEAAFDQIHAAGWSNRRDFAEAVTRQPAHLRPYLFLLLDNNKDKAADLAWRAVKPSGAGSLINHSEAVA